MSNTITVSHRFCGPPTSGNGGYSCGMLDKHTDYLSEVTLRKPIPLDVEMEVVEEEGQLKMMAGEELIATVRPGTLDLEVPPAPDFAVATASSKTFVGYQEKPAFPTCFVCGVDRETGDGLRVFAGATPVENIYAAPWIPAADLAGDDGSIRSEFIWAALDCPGAYAIMDDELKTVLLGRFTAEVLHPIQPGEACVVTAWKLGEDGRKFFSGTALFNEAGQLCAKAKAVWIEIVKV